MIKTLLISSMSILLLSGCTIKADYEDKDMTSAFIEKNKDKLEYIYDIKSYMINTLDGVTVKTHFSESFWDYLFPDVEIHSKIYGCNYVIHIDSNELQFYKNDLVKYGKEYMFEEAQECLDSVVEKIMNDKYIKEQRDKKEIEALNKKFDKNN